MRIYMILNTPYHSFSRRSTLAKCSDPNEIRLAIKDQFPNVTVVASQLDPWPSGGMRVVVYASSNKRGEGRIGGQFQEWAISFDPQGVI